MKLCDLSVKRPIGVLMITLTAAALGLFFLSSLSVDLLPRFDYPMIRIMVGWKGASPLEVEENISKKIESVVATTEGATKVISESIEGRASVEVYFQYGKNMDWALSDTREKLDQVRRDLPVDADVPQIIKADPSTLPVVDLAFYSDKRDELALRQWLEMELAPRFLGLPGLGTVTASGGKVREIQVVFNQELLQHYEIPVARILGTLKAENIDFPAGRITGGNREYSVRLLSKYKSAADIAGIVIANREGRIVKLYEVATVKDGFAEQRVLVRMNGAPSVILSFFKQPNANTVEVAEKIIKKARQLKNRKEIPDDVRFVVASSQSYYISTAIENVGSSAVMGGLLAVFVIWFFLIKLKRTLVIAISIPVSILTTFILMGLFDITLNVFSLGGLVLAVGMLVDNSAVMLENITRHHRMTGDAIRAAHDASSEVASPLIASTLTNLAAIFPFFFIQGLSALLFRDMVITIVIAYVVSLLAALTIVPSLSGRLFRHEKIDPASGMATRMMDRILSGYRTVLASIMRYRGISLLAIFALFIASIMQIRTLGKEFIPAVDDGKITVRIKLPIGTALVRTVPLTLKIEELIQKLPGVENILTMAGGYWSKKSIYEKGNESELTVQLVEKSRRPLSTTDFIKKLRTTIKASSFSDARIMVTKAQLRGIKKTSGSDIDIRLRGREIATLYAIASDITNRIRDVHGLANLDISLNMSRPEIHVELYRERLSDFGLSAQDVAGALLAVVDGTVKTRLTDRKRDTEYDIRLMADPNSISDPQKIGNTLLYPASGVEVRLREVAKVSLADGPVEVFREDQVRLIEATGDAIGRNVGIVTADVKRRLAGLVLPDGYSLSYGGEDEATSESDMQLMIAVIIGILLVFVVMAVQYESLVDPLVIMVTIPLALIGAIFALSLTGTPVGATVILGFILLVGIVVNNAIIMIEYANHIGREKRTSAAEAILEAASLRLRPILITSLTTIIGLLPLAVGWGEGLEMLTPLAIAVVGGMTVSTLLTLFIVPCLYAMFHRKNMA